jgi:hypothetical protein
MLPPIATYYLLCEALKYQTPKVVLINGRSLFAEADTDEYEPWLRTAFDHMRLSRNKMDAIEAIVADSGSQTRIDYLLPLLRYHSRDDLTEVDYDLSYYFERSLHMGAWRDMETTFRAQKPRPASFDDPDFVDEFELRDKYLDMCIEKCKEYGIDVVLVVTPSLLEGRWSLDKGEALKAYAEKQDVYLIDFNDLEMFESLGLDPATDFFDHNHVNLFGGTKTSRYIAQFLALEFALPDRRQSDYDPHWDAVVAFHEERLAELRDFHAERENGNDGSDDLGEDG